MPELLSEDIHIFNTQDEEIRIEWNRRLIEPGEDIIPIYKETLEFIISDKGELIGSIENLSRVLNKSYYGLKDKIEYLKEDITDSPISLQ